MYQIIEQTYEEKFKMYNKLSKKELIMMLIEANKHLNGRPLTWINEGFFPNQDYTTFGELCPCNPRNGGSGLCSCVLANQVVR
jgi:hypothetical protein